MKRIVAGIIIAIIGCVYIPSWVDAQPRDGGRGRGRGRGIAEQDYRGQRRAYRGRQQRRRYHGGRWEWYDYAPPGAVGGFLGGLVGGWLSRQGQEEEPPPEAPMTDEASLEPWSPGWIAYCKRKYRSFDIKDGRYLSYDGNRYFCNPDKG